MGGNALKPFEVRRVSKDEYFDLTKEVISMLKDVFPNIVFFVPDAYRSKPDFGDIDVLAHSLPDNFDEMVLAGHPAKAYSRNTNIFSFEYKDVQVDLINIPKDSAHFAYRYFSYNDLGGLIHVIAKQLGFYIGQKGLYYKLYLDAAQNQYVGDVVLTTDFDEALSFLGLDPGRYAQGFDTLEDIFEFVESSTFYKAEYFQFENRNAHDRFRDQKRKTYMGFLERIAKNAPDAEAKKSTPFATNAVYHFVRACRQFPKFDQQCIDLISKVEKWETTNEKLRGMLLADTSRRWLPENSKVPEVGHATNVVRYVVHKSGGPEALVTYLEPMTDAEVKYVLDSFVEDYQKSGYPLQPRVTWG